MLCIRRVGVKGETAEELKRMLIDVLDEFTLDKKKLSAIGTDGASNMTGKRAGLVALLREEEGMSSVIGVHCACHKAHLAAKASVKYTSEERSEGVDEECDDMEEIVKILNDIAHFYNKHPLRSRDLETKQRILREQRKKRKAEKKRKEEGKGKKKKKGRKGGKKRGRKKAETF
jgi:hypothetical protein